MFDAQEFARRLAHRQDRWSLLKDFVAEWHTPLQEGDGYSAAEVGAAEKRLGFKLPLALREWYQLGGKREALLSRDPYVLLGPDDLTLEDEVLSFVLESQAGVDWGIQREEMHLVDPPVMIGDDGWVKCNSTLSEFILQMLLLQTMIAGMGGNAEADDRTHDIVETNFVLLGFPDWPGYPSRLYGGPDTLIHTDGQHWVFVAARNSEALARTSDLLDLRWNVLHDGVSIRDE